MSRHLYLTLALLATLLVSECLASGGDFAIETNEGDAHFCLVQGDDCWWCSMDTAMHMNGKRYSQNSNNLQIKSTQHSTGADRIGTFSRTAWTWTADGSEVFETALRSYSDATAFVFEQTALTDLTGTSTGNSSALATEFPSISFNELSILGDLNTFTFSKMWDTGTIARGVDTLVGGIDGGVPLCIYDDTLENIVIFSPITNFKVGFHSSNRESRMLTFGLNGLVDNIEKGFHHEEILYYGSGMNQTFFEWGQLLLKLGNKTATPLDSDVTTTHLGYWTDNGAYYYYQTEKGKTVEETFLDVKTYLESIGINAYKYFQFDSWWYYKGKDGGVALWEPRPDQFPSGFTAYAEKMNATWTLHNRYWASDTMYNETQYPFWKEGKYALPKTFEFWQMIMSEAKKWKVTVYEQDWLIDQYSGMQITQNNTFVAHEWMTNMSIAAQQNNLHIQYCMPLPMDYLESTLHVPVTQIRASDDYQPGKKPQWQIGMTSRWAWSLGLIPFKDNFWTSKREPGNRFTPGVEPNPALEVAAAVFSAGPIALADAITYVNASLLKGIADSEGLILKPDLPAMAIEKSYLPLRRPQGHISITFRSLSDSDTQARLYYALAANLSAPFTLTPSDFELTNLTESGKQSRVFSFSPHTLSYAEPDTVAPPFSSAQPIHLSTQISNTTYHDPPAQSSLLPYRHTDHSILLIVPPAQPHCAHQLIGAVDFYVSSSRQLFTRVQCDPSTGTLSASLSPSFAIAPSVPLRVAAVDSASGAVLFAHCAHSHSLFTCHDNQCQCK